MSTYIGDVPPNVLGWDVYFGRNPPLFIGYFPVERRKMRIHTHLSEMFQDCDECRVGTNILVSIDGADEFYLCAKHIMKIVKKQFLHGDGDLEFAFTDE